MAQPILVLMLQRAKLESVSQRFRDKGGKPTEELRTFQAETQKAVVENGGKRIVLASDMWGFSGWDTFIVAEFPSIENWQKCFQRSQELQYSRYFDVMVVPGIDRLKSFEDQEHIRKVHK